MSPFTGLISIHSSWTEGGMRRTLTTFITVWFVLVMPLRLAAQQNLGTNVGGFTTTGSITGGYRFTDVSGRRQKYNELFDLRTGFRLFDVNVAATAVDNQRFADSVFFFASGIGGDPFQAGQLRVT